MANVSMAPGLDSLVEGGNRNWFQFPAVVKVEEQSTATEPDIKLGKEPYLVRGVGSESEPLGAQFQFLKTSWVDELGSLSNAIHVFQCRLNELQDHLHFIHNAVVTRSKNHISSSPSSNRPQINHQQPPSVRDTKITSASDSSTIVATAESGGQPVTSGRHLSRSPGSNNPKTTGNCGKNDKKDSMDMQSQSSSLSELEHLCETMCSRGLRKYIVSHLSDLANLRRQIPLALKCAPKPAKLVFDCIGRFYLQGSKAYSKDSPMIPARQASVLILELFLLSGADETENDKKMEIEPSIKVEADLAATAWRKRLINESGLFQASDIDARGLLLFLACFGISPVFTNDDLRDLLRSSNSKGISNALRRSRSLCTRIPDIIKGMTKDGMNVEAVDIVYSFGLEDVFPPGEILSSFLQECAETWKRRIKELQGSTMQLRQVNEKKLASLKSVLKCLEDHEIDPVKFLPGWKIQEMMINLENDIADLDKKLRERGTMKRKTDETSSQNYQSLEIKRSRVASEGYPVPVNGLLEPSAAPCLDNKSSYSSSMPKRLFDGGRPAHLGNYQISSSLPGSSLESLAGSVSCRVTLGQGGVHAGGVDTVLPAEISVISKGPFPSHLRAMGLDNNGASIYKMGSTHEMHGIGDAALKDKSIGQSFFQQATPPVESNCFYRLPPSIERFVGMPRYATSSHLDRTKTYDLYHFADTVFEGESHKSTTQSASLPRLRPSHHSPYFYK